MKAVNTTANRVGIADVQFVTSCFCSPGEETHFAITIVSPRFANLPDVQRQRLIYKSLKEELSSRIHALSINARSVDETLKPHGTPSCPNRHSDKCRENAGGQCNCKKEP
ncbi:unnamed protein product [Calicophoron daubneyi]|uniref:BolA-like protein 1 n=1 Tax=Calicophoron daubneyi TaxID=300641 RepID=A0AAV2TS44_CALDB